jgi:hypothetical protein
MASLIKKGMGLKGFFRLWEEYHTTEPAKGELNISLPSWHSSLKYRERVFDKVTDMLGVSWAFTDVNRDMVPGAGGGSSFDGQKIPGSQMNVLKRYAQVDLKKHKVPKELKELDRKIYPELYGEEK